MVTGGVLQRSGVAFVGCGLLLAGCGSDECKSGLAEAAELERKDNFADGRALLNRLERTHGCSSAEFQTKLHAFAIAEQAQKKRDQEARAQQRVKEQVEAVEQFEDFLSWVAEYRRRPGEAEGGRECYGPGDAEAGYCMVMVDGEGRRVNWMHEDPRRVQFSSEGLSPLLRPSCEGIGTKRIRKWQWKDIGVHYHCRFARDSKRFSGMQAWIKHAKNRTYFAIFSDEFLIDPPYDIDETLRSQGQTIP